MTAAYRRLDSQYGGGHARDTVARYAHAVSRDERACATALHQAEQPLDGHRPAQSGRGGTPAVRVVHQTQTLAAAAIVDVTLLAARPTC